MGIYLRSSSNTSISNNTISSNNDYGILLSLSSGNTIITGNTISNNTAGIYLHSSSNTSITGSTITNNDVGIYLRYSSDNIANFNSIFSNTYYGIADGSIDATYNYWGDDSGPYHPEKNPQGRGDNVTDHVLFDPWLGKGETTKTILYVDGGAAEGGDGSRERPFRRIQDGIDNASEGASIYVWEGVYYENVVVNRTLGLIGNGSANTTIDGGGAGDVVRIVADWCNMSGFGIRNSGSSYWNDAGIELQADNTTITNNTISNNVNGILLDSSSNTSITNNTIDSNSNVGIFLSTSSNTTITGNTIANNHEGVCLYSSSNNTVHLNNIVANTNYGIYVNSENDSILAEENWWGHESGPYHPEENQHGGGDNVSDFVDFSPWLDEDGNPVEKNRDTNEKSHVGLYGLLASILFILIMLVVVVRLPDRYFKRRHPSKSIESDQTPPQPPLKFNRCPYCGGKFEGTTQKRPIQFNCHFCGKELEFE